jgi:hypothetical protein
MNLSINTALHDFGDVAEDACKNELVQLFKVKNALVPVKKQDLSEEQLKKVVRSHMFLKEKFEDGTFVKLKARLVADGRTQDRTLYSDYSSPTAKTRSIMTCLKIAAVKKFECVKVDIGGAFLCVKIDRRGGFPPTWLSDDGYGHKIHARVSAIQRGVWDNDSKGQQGYVWVHSIARTMVQ